MPCKVDGPGRPLIPSFAGDPTNDQGGGPNLAIRPPQVFLVAIVLPRIFVCARLAHVVFWGGSLALFDFHRKNEILMSQLPAQQSVGQ